MVSLPPLREYQVQAIEALRASLAHGKRRPVLVSPTGSGKTRTAVEVIRLATEKGNTVLLLAPRRELIYQASGVLERAGIRHGVIMAGEPMNRYASVQVASFDTLWARRNKMPMPDAELVIVDEAHLSIAETRRKLLDSYPEARIVGLTATPARGDGRGLGEIYDDLVEAWPIGRLQEAGYLVPTRYFVPSKPDLEGVKRRKDGDYQEEDLGHRMDRPQLVGDIVRNWLRIAPGKSSVVFCVTRSHSRHVRDEFLRAGVRAEHLDGETPLDERKRILERVESGQTTVLCNVFVATFGLDIPRLEVAVMARPTRNVTLYLQTVGRVLRPFEGKDEAIIIDHAGAVDEHGRVEDDFPWSLGDDETVQERKKKQQAERKEPKDLTCPSCKTVFRGSRICPSCGHELIPPGKPVPYHEADLEELNPKKENRTATWEEKIAFMAGLKAYAKKHGYREGWVAHKYRSRFSVWPNDPRVKHCEPGPITPEVAGWIKHEQIKFAKRRAAA